VEQGVGIDAETVFEVGSLSKQFTATAILLLAQDGKVTLDDDVRKYVPELPDYTLDGSKKSGRAITLRDLLEHTSGLRDYSWLLQLAGYEDSDLTTESDALWLITHQRALNFPVGTRHAYSNSGYVLLALVVKKVAGMTLAAFAKQRIFDPLGMMASLFLEDRTRVVRHRALAYETGAEGPVLAMSGRQQSGDGGLMTSVADLARWDANFYVPKVGGAAWRETMRSAGKLDDGAPISYAMGLELGATNGVPFERHDGERAGFHSAMIRFPTERLAIAVLCNVAESDAMSLATAVASALLPKLAVTEQGGSADRPAPEQANVAASELGPALGRYVDPVSFEVRTLSLDGAALKLGFSVNGHSPRTLDVRDARHFSIHGGAAEYEFVPAAGSTPARLLRVTGGRTQTFERFERGRANPAALTEYAGRYWSDELPRDAAIVVDEGCLRLVPWGRSPGPWTITPIRRDVFAIDGGTLRFERDERSHVVGFAKSFPPHIEGIQWTRRAETNH
jgi:CubicO group peptidase (beta-lactamase class C family)